MQNKFYKTEVVKERRFELKVRNKFTLLFKELFVLLRSLLGLSPRYARFGAPKNLLVVFFCGAEEDRTPDPLLAKQVLSQLSYSPLIIDSL